jgi:hypothetical protein
MSVHTIGKTKGQYSIPVLRYGIPECPRESAPVTVGHIMPSRGGPDNA